MALEDQQSAELNPDAAPVKEPSLPLIILAFWIGIYPKPFLEVLDRPVKQLVQAVNPDWYGAEEAGVKEEDAKSDKKIQTKGNQ